MKIINFEKLDNSGYYTPRLGSGTRRVAITESPFSFWLLGQESYKLLGYWEITKIDGYEMKPYMYNMWLNCDDGIAHWNHATQQLEELEISTASDMKFKNMNGEDGFYVLYKMKDNGYERPIIVESGYRDRFNSLISHLRDQAQGKPTSYILLELAQWSRYRPKVLDSSNNSLTYVDQWTDTGLYQIPWAIQAGRGKTAFLTISMKNSQFGRDTAIAYGEDKEIANYWANRASDTNKVGRITPAFTGYEPSLYVVHADPSADRYKKSLFDLHHMLVANYPSDNEEEVLSFDNTYIAA